MSRSGAAAKKPLPETSAVRSGLASDREHGAVMPPLYLSSNFTFADLGEPRPYDYTRSGNPTRDLLGSTLAELEGGAGAVVTSSGMSAIHLVTQLLAPEDLVVATKDCYGGTHRLLCGQAKKGVFRSHFADLGDPVCLAESLELAPKLLWLESPSNPLLRITDIERLCQQAHAVGALVAVDNTFLSPALQRPLDLGADLVVHSTTKYLNGHSDVVGGAVVAASQELLEELAWWANSQGLTGSPYDSFMTSRGLRTLHVRIRQQETSATALAHLLAGHDAVSKVYYPGLPEHPGHALAARQQKGFGAMLSFELLEGLKAVGPFLRGLRFFSLAESLGGVESLVAHPATMTHAAMEAAARREAGIGDGLLRLSVGLEAEDDLLADLRAALDRADRCSLALAG